MKVAWLAPYPVPLLQPSLQLARQPTSFHPCSWIVHLSRALAQRSEIELHLVTESPLVHATQTVEQDNIAYHIVKTGIPGASRGWPQWLPFDALTGFQARIRQLCREVRLIKPDLVHAHGTEAAYGRAGMATGLPCLLSMQGIVTEISKTNPSFGFRLIRHWEQQTVRQAQFFVCRTDFDTGFVRSINPAARIFTIHEAMNPVYFTSEWNDPQTNRLLFVGGLSPWKGLPVLLEALSLVRRKQADVCLDVVGSGGPDYTEELRRLCQRLDLTEAVNFLGQRTAEEIVQRQLRAQIFVLPSDNENSPNTLAEAMVIGMPVIATKVGGVPSMVEEGETGVLVPPRDAQLLAERIIWMLGNPAERLRLGRNARAIARERHAKEKVAAETVAAYKKINSLTGGNS